MSYTDTTLLNCNRSASVQAKSLPINNTNPALFTNTLQQTVDLDVGDKISIERAFISEVGAGNSSTIEFKGSVRGSNKIPTYTNTIYGNKNFTMKTTHDPNYRLGNYLSMTTTEVTSDEVELRDNLAPLTFGYYITSNEYPNYTQQPRRYIQRMDERDIIPFKNSRGEDNFITYDAISTGLPYFTINENCILDADWDLRQAAPAPSTSTFHKQKCDNTRYTLFVKDFIAYSYGLSTDPIKANLQFPDRFRNGIISEANYLRVREKLEVEVKKGFNTPTAVASQITSQLTKTQNESVFNILDGKGFSRQITKTTENTTYKPMNCQNVWNMSLATFNAFNAYDPEKRRADPPVLPNQSAVDYIANFGYIAVKRPELFETGRTMMNAIVPFTAELKEVSGGGVVSTRIPVLTRNTLPDGLTPATLIPNGFLGFQHIGTTTYSDPSGGENQNDLKDLITNIPYTQENLGIIRDFLDTQALYPEIWTSLVNSIVYRPSNIFGAHTLTSETSRFFHMNTRTSDTTVGVHQQMLGQDGYHLRAAPNNINLASLPIFMAWDESQRDLYIEPEAYAGYRTNLGVKIDGLMYGFAIPHLEQSFEGGGVVVDRWVIKIATGDTPNGAGGLPKSFFTEAGKITDGRRLGFDFNSNAYSTAIITPFSGYSNAAISTRVQFDYDSANPTQSGYWSDTSNIMPNITETTKGTDIGAYMTQTYIGANNPAIEYNTVSNRFEFSRLHTANNVGNKLMAGCQFDNINNETITPDLSSQARDLAPPSVNPDAADTVYKIGPRPPQFGFSPTFKPYATHNQAYRTGVYPSTPKDQATIALAGTKNTNLIDVQNPNIEPFSIFDSHGGIYIDDFGISEDDWEDNLWDILGFDYSAVAAKPSKDNVLTKRVSNDNNIPLYRPTTNAETVATDAKAYVANRFGVNMYYTSLAYPMNILTYLTGLTASGSPNYNFVLKDPNGTGEALTYIPEIVVKTQSTTITATDLQKSILKPYYTIRSSLLEGATAIGGNPSGASLPIIGIVDKYSAYGDYFTGQSDIQFTVTKKAQIADIITSIHDPDGEYANVDNTSAVIYKLEKLKSPPINIIAELLKESEKDKKKK